MELNEVAGQIAGHVVQAHDISGGVHIGQTPSGPISQLPAVAPHFVGRRPELDYLTSRLTTSRALAITSIGGTAGIGKTSLALHWAHQVKDQFSDGQLYVDLLGFGPGEPLDPATVVQGFLAAFQVPKERIPHDVGAQAALYRSLVADRKVLVLLDNARDSEQVRPLLPGSPTCVVLVTSRNRLTGLIARERAAHLELDFPSFEESREMLTAYIGEPRAAKEGPAITELIERCARLPIALTIAGARAVTEPHRPLNRLVTELAELSTGDSADTDIRAVFHSSYRTLAPDAARLFRLLGLHPGTNVGVAAAASLAGLPMSHTQRLLATLTRASLLFERVPDRFQFHDLLREYAVEHVKIKDSTRERRDAVTRMLDHYLHTAFANDRALYPLRDSIQLERPRDGVSTTPEPDHYDAWTWFLTERGNLLHAVDLAVREGFDGHVWRLGWSLSTYFGRTGSWHDWENTQHKAVLAARRLGDASAEATSLRILGRIMTLIARYPEAIDFLEQASRTSTDTNGHAHIHQALSLAHERRGALKDAHFHAERAATLAESTGHRLRRARALSQLGRVQSELGANAEAYASCQLAVQMLTKAGDQVSLGDAIEGLGRAAHGLKDFSTAASYYRRALDLFQEYSDLHSQAHVLRRLGNALDANGEHDAARRAWLRAADMFTELHHPDAEELRAKTAR
jgi:tetratricopeptide (TPR) repeat protein